ncbi:MAG TPA: rhodanese [Sedimenticola thiotaurini]|uniref:Rhodanese n=1 Tax=Sedimenticola thiotaurini TaxID=1543721 RepID=A0A831RM25_9GAMM|nr:rhodanese [Sedimenticola thiotaurini]
MKIYLVGGAVRDRLLDLPVRDRDWVVVGATEQEMLDLGFRRADAEFPVFLHPETGEEYALARREVKTGPGYKGFAVDAGPDVTLEEDLVRRDLTINALAEDGEGRVIDLFDGREDLDQGLLRHISPAFVEDPVRLLRIARFAARLGRWGFRVAHGTHRLLQRMAASDELAALRPERLWLEMKWSLAEDQPWRFFQVLQRCGALERLIPELAGVMDDVAGHGGRDDGTVLAALERVAAATTAPEARFAVAFHDAALEAGDPAALLHRLRAERDYSELLLRLLALGPCCRAAAAGDARALLELLERGRARQQPRGFSLLIEACMALHPRSAGPLREAVERAQRVLEEVTPALLQREGLTGRALGEALRQRRLERLQSWPDSV